MRIREVVSDPASTVEEVTAVIGKDPSLTAKLLKLVNSAFYARTLRVSGGMMPRTRPRASIHSIPPLLPKTGRLVILSGCSG